MSSRIALFDMDRTLLKFNSAASYVRWRHKHGLDSTWHVLEVALWLMRYRFGVLDAPSVARKVARRFSGDLECELQQDCVNWYQAEVRAEISLTGRAKVEQHLNANHVVAVITSSTRYVSELLAKDLGISHVLCTELEVTTSGHLTGNVRGPVCYGQGKIAKATEWARALGLEVENACFYTDSITDTPLLTHVREPVAVNPDPRLKSMAAARGWPIEYWLE